MWSITTLHNKTIPEQPVAVSDGLPVSARRGGAGKCFRVVVKQFGFLDIVDTGHQQGGPHYWQLKINGKTYWYDGEGSLSVTILNDGSFTVEGDGNHISGVLKPLPSIDEKDIVLFQDMIAKKLVPYQNIPDEPGKTKQEIEKLGRQYFPYTKYSFELAMAIYDWTTASFARMDFIRMFTYTGVAGRPMDRASIVNAIWTSDWPPYTPQNKYYMHSFMMSPAHSSEDVRIQLDKVADALQRCVDAEINLITSALQSMPPTSTIEIPKLYSGQVSMSNLGTHHFPPEFQEFPGNYGPVDKPLEMPIDHALQTFMRSGQTITTKVVMSFTDSEKDAMHYQNGILLKVSPPDDAIVWPCCRYITPLSDGPDKIEYTFQPGTRFLIKHSHYETILGKRVLVFHLQLIGCDT